MGVKVREDGDEMVRLDLPVKLPLAREYQRRILEDPARFKLLICGRRWGKTKLGMMAACQGHGPRTWRRPSADNPQLTKADAVEARETLGERAYLREYEARLLSVAGGIWKEVWLRPYVEAPAAQDVAARRGRTRSSPRRWPPGASAPTA